MKYKGKVKSGLGDACNWMEKTKDVFKSKYDMEVFLGTLNVELEEEIALSEDEKILPSEYGGIFNVFVKECKVNGYKGYILRTEKNNKKGGDHPLNIIEIVSDVSFRKMYNLEDNDEVEIEIL